MEREYEKEDCRKGIRVSQEYRWQETAESQRNLVGTSSKWTLSADTN